MTAEGSDRRFVAAAGIACALLSLAAGPAAELQMFGDGSIFAYAIAVGDAWAFHWHNISGRLFSYVFIHAPAEAVVATTGSARAGIFVYGLLHYAAPALSLLTTRTLDRTAGRPVFVTACLSTTVVLPLVFGFPTEMWMAHALFWPALAVGLDARRGIAARFGLLLALVLTHEGGVVLAGSIVAASALRGPHSHELRRTATAFAGAMALWAAVKIGLPPDDHIAGVLGAAAHKFVDPGNFGDPAFLLLAVALAAYVLGVAVFRAPVAVALGVAAVLVAYWVWFDRFLLAEARYALRTALLAATPCLGLLAVLGVPLRIDPTKLACAVALALLVHGVETAKFVAGWLDYKEAVRGLATGSAADPGLGDARFVSAARLTPSTNRLAWNSTTPYLSILVTSDLAPPRLVVDPAAGYFWLSCATATRSAASGTAVPASARELVRRYACLHR